MIFCLVLKDNAERGRIFEQALPKEGIHEYEQVERAAYDKMNRRELGEASGERKR